MGLVSARNKKSTADMAPPSGYTSWLDFWENEKSRKANQCEVFCCNRSPDLGGHIYFAGSGGKDYILPMCACHNEMPEDNAFLVWDYDLQSVT